MDVSQLLDAMFPGDEARGFYATITWMKRDPRHLQT